MCCFQVKNKCKGRSKVAPETSSLREPCVGPARGGVGGYTLLLHRGVCERGFGRRVFAVEREGEKEVIGFVQYTDGIEVSPVLSRYDGT